MRVSRLLLLLASALIATPHDSFAQGVSVTVILPGFRGVVRMDSVGTPEAVPAAPGAVFGALRQAFDSLGIETTVRDSAAGMVGNLGLKVTRRFAGQPVSRWVDCGTTHTGPTANAYRVHLAVLGAVAPGPDGGSVVRVSVAAGAQAFSGPLGDPISCESTGALEQRLLQFARTRLDVR